MPGSTPSARDILDELVAEAAPAGVTVVIASHEAELVESLATRAVTVTGGRVTAERPSVPAAGRRRRGDRSRSADPAPAAGQPPGGQVAHVA